MVHSAVGGHYVPPSEAIESSIFEHTRYAIIRKLDDPYWPTISKESFEATARHAVWVFGARFRS